MSGWDWDQEPNALDPFTGPRVIRVTHIGREAPAITTLARQRDDLAAYCERLEAEIVCLRRQVARLTAERDGEPHRAAPWETALAWLVCRLDAANRKMKGWDL